MKFRVEANQRGNRWAARVMDNYKVYYRTFETEKEAQMYLLEFQIMRLEKIIYKFRKRLEKL